MAKRPADPIAAYAAKEAPERRAICELLRERIDAAIPGATSRIWHGAPVWFVGENPVAGYDAMAKGVRLLFWNGGAFGKVGLEPVGKHGAAQALFRDASEIDPKALGRWLRLAGSKVLDSKAHFQRLREERKRGRPDSAL